MLPNTGNLLREGVAFGETPTRTYGLRLLDPETRREVKESFLILDGGTPSAPGEDTLVDGGGPGTFDDLELLVDGAGPRSPLFLGSGNRRTEWEGVITGFVDGLDAMRQAIYLVLNTERYAYRIYSWNYGVELESLYGTQMDYAMSEVKRRIAEALLQDSRITAVNQFEFETSGENLHVRFAVHTIFGDVEAERTVRI